MTLASLVLALSGFAGIALSMHKHHGEAFGTAPSRMRAQVLRCAGWVLLGLSFAASISAAGWSVGPALWAGLLSVAGLVVTLAFTFLGRLRR